MASETSAHIERLKKEREELLQGENSVLWKKIVAHNQERADLYQRQMLDMPIRGLDDMFVLVDVRSRLIGLIDGGAAIQRLVADLDSQIADLSKGARDG